MPRIAALVAALAAILMLLACGSGSDRRASDDPQVPSPAVTVQVNDAATPSDGSPVGDDGEEGACGPNPSPATEEFQVIHQPAAGVTVTSPVTVSGEVAALDGAFQVVILDERGDPIAGPLIGMAEAAGPGELAPFSIDIPFEATAEQEACIWIFELSSLDGSQIHVGQIPVILSP